MVFFQNAVLKLLKEQSCFLCSLIFFAHNIKCIKERTNFFTSLKVLWTFPKDHLCKKTKSLSHSADQRGLFCKRSSFSIQMQLIFPLQRERDARKKCCIQQVHVHSLLQVHVHSLLLWQVYFRQLETNSIRDYLPQKEPQLWFWGF